MNQSAQKNGDTERKTDFDLPSLWEDDDEMYHLMGAFRRPRAMEEAEYDFKVSFWRSLIERRGRDTRAVVLSEVELSQAFRREFNSTGVVMKPRCLGRVLAHMRAEDRLVEPTTFRQRSILRRAVSGLAWAFTAPLKWSFSQVSSLVSLSESFVEQQQLQDITTGDFVLVDLIPDLVYNFINLLCSEKHLHISPHIDAFSLAHYNNILTLYVSHQASKIFLHDYLIRNRLVENVTLRNSSESIVIVKFARSIETPLNNMGIEKSLEDQVVGFVQLRTLKTKLETDECTIQAKVDQLKQEVLRCLRSNKKDEAKTFLKREKIIEKMLERKRVQIDNVESMLVQIDAADDNMQVIKALSMAAGALKAQSIDVDCVHDVMAEIGDAIANHEEINSSISVLSDSTQNEMMNLEIELATLIVDDSFLDEVNCNLPDVPNESLNPTRKTVSHKMAKAD